MLAIIGGTGFGEFAGLEGIEALEVETDFGRAYVEKGELNGRELLFLPRHGHPPRFPPHKINYRANIDALRLAGATSIIAVTAVGTVDESLGVPALVVPDQVIDYTWGRDQTFYHSELFYIDLTWPYDETLRQSLLSAVAVCRQSSTNIDCRAGGVYGCAQGPRLETAAEIRRMRRDGCHIVGMTAMPEVALARERNIPYAGISVTVNAGAGINDQIVELDEIEAAMAKGMVWVRDIIREICQGDL